MRVAMGAVGFGPSPGADFDHADARGWTALMFSALEGDVPVVQCLLAAGAAIDRADEWLERARDYVREKPVQSVAIALGAGWLLGRILRR